MNKPYFISGLWKWGATCRVREVVRQMCNGSFDPCGSYIDQDYNAKYIAWASSKGNPLRAMARIGSRSHSR